MVNKGWPSSSSFAVTTIFSSFISRLLSFSFFFVGVFSTGDSLNKQIYPGYILAINRTT